MEQGYKPSFYKRTSVLCFVYVGKVTYDNSNNMERLIQQ